MNRKFQISVRSRFAELWRYNIVVMCGAYNSSGEQLAVTSSQSIVADVGDDVDKVNVNSGARRDVKLETQPCDNIKAFIYIMPHKLPSSRELDQTLDFDVRIEVSAEREEIYNIVHRVNQWSGATIELTLPKRV